MPSGLILIDKAPDWTSHDVVAKCRGLLHEKRIGHTGTLDPMATGLLVLLIGRATRAAVYCPGEKTYKARLRFGLETDTQDSSGNIVRNYDNIPDAAALQNILPLFTGAITQIPPMVSAVKVGGKRLYALAREGKEVERAPRPVTIHGLCYLGQEKEEHILRVTCSAGTYIRTLIHDIGKALETGAVMTGLRRENAGSFSVEDAVSVEDACWERLIPTDRLFKAFPAVTVLEKDLTHALNGAPFSVPSGLPEGKCRVYDKTGRFLLLGEHSGSVVRTIKSFWEWG